MESTKPVGNVFASTKRKCELCDKPLPVVANVIRTYCSTRCSRIGANIKGVGYSLRNMSSSNKKKTNKAQVKKLLLYPVNNVGYDFC